MELVTKQNIRMFLLLILMAHLSACAHSPRQNYPFDFSLFRDQPVPTHTAEWLKGGPQSTVTPFIRAAAFSIKGNSRRERLFKAMDYIWDRFRYDERLNTAKFTLTADDLFKSGELGGCGDYALVEIALFRAVGIPSRMVVTANVDWIYQFRKNNLSLTEGHSFIEVYLEDRWHLLDSTYRWLFCEYDPDSLNFPHGEHFFKRGRDFWDMGIKSGQDLDRLLGKHALGYKGDFREPRYPRYPI